MRAISGVLLASLPHLAWADLPLTVADLITDKGKVKLKLSMSYVNADRQGISTADPLTIQTGPASVAWHPASAAATWAVPAKTASRASSTPGPGSTTSSSKTTACPPSLGLPKSPCVKNTTSAVHASSRPC
jgi:hypothetical protein